MKSAKKLGTLKRMPVTAPGHSFSRTLEKGCILPVVGVEWEALLLRQLEAAREITPLAS